MRTFQKMAIAALLALGLAGCAGDPVDYSEMPRMPVERGHSVAEADTHKPLQCVPYAREHSGIKIYGDASTWWDKASGKYARGSSPDVGAVMVLHDYAGADHGHVAVVKTLVSSREIRIDHANWLDDGAIYVNDPVMDVSSGNDWSAVRVYNIKSGGWGKKVYPVQGFIGGREGSEDELPPLVARNSGAATRMAALAPVDDEN